MTATSGFLTALEYTKLVFDRGSAPDPAYSAPPDLLAGLRWNLQVMTSNGKGPLEGCPCIFAQGPPSSKLRHCMALYVLLSGEKGRKRGRGRRREREGDEREEK